MPLTFVLIVPRRGFIADTRGFGHQVPLGMLCIGGPLIDDGHQVHLIDNDLEGLPDVLLARKVAALSPDAVLLGHPASYAAHPALVRTAKALRQHLPEATFVCGGVYPSSAAEEVLLECPELDIVVRGEGEATGVSLARALAAPRGQARRAALAKVEGISYREGRAIHRNRDRALIQNLDAYRPGFELVDFERYPLLGLGPTAGFFFSRGCPHACTFCGQFAFWKRWRHRSPANVVEQLRVLVEVHGVRSVWFADENFGTDPKAARALLEAIVEAKLDLALNINLTAADIVRDAKLLPLYRRAGVIHVSLGIETLDDERQQEIGKNNPAKTSAQAIALLRAQGIMSMANVIYGFEQETPRSILRTLWGLAQVAPDVINAVFLTPLFFTVEGRRTDRAALVSADQSRYTYRDPVIRPKAMAVTTLFLLVKLTELLFHTRPKALWRMFFGLGRRRRALVRRYFLQGISVWLAEIAEFFGRRDLVPEGAVHRLPGEPRVREKRGLRPHDEAGLRRPMAA